MTRAFLVAFLVGLGSIAAGPASAAWDYIGYINVGYGRDHDRTYANFGGPVERLRFKAGYNDVFCRSIRATFANGRSREIFSGELYQGRRRIVDLPGDERHIRRLDFRCGTGYTSGATIDIAADVASGNGDYWVTIGEERFSGRIDRETSFTGIRGRNVSGIGLRALDDDARCARVTAHFANGRSRRVDVDWGDRIREDRFYRFDLPGAERNVVRIDMTCRPIGDRDVTIRLYAAK